MVIFAASLLLVRRKMASQRGDGYWMNLFSNFFLDVAQTCGWFGVSFCTPYCGVCVVNIQEELFHNLLAYFLQNCLHFQELDIIRRNGTCRPLL